MLVKSFNKLFLFYVLYLLPSVLPIILITKTNLRIRNFLDPMIADGNFVAVPTQVFDYLNRTTKGALGIDHPVFFKQTVKQGLITNLFLTEFNNVFCSEYLAHRLD